MPLGRIVVEQSPERAELQQALVNEWREPDLRATEPVIIEEAVGFDKRYIRVYVVWSRWRSLSQTERSDIIVEAMRDVRGADEMARVTVAMGLTPEEAERMGIRYEAA
jgi:hypothetical protein